MSLRVILVTLLLGLPLFLKLQFMDNSTTVVFFYLLIATTYFFSIVYFIFIRFVRNPLTFVAVHLTSDLFLETAFIVTTRGYASPFIFLYVLSIMMASFFFYRIGGILMATGATLGIGLAVGLQYLQIPSIPFSGMLTGNEALYIFIANGFTFYALGTVMGSLSSRLKEKDIRFSDFKVRHENIVQSIPSGILTTNEAGQVTSFNQFASDNTGFTPEEAIGATWWDLFSCDIIRVRYRDLAVTGAPQRFQADIINKKGETILLGITISGLRNDEGELIGVLGSFQDLTRLKHLEEQVQGKKHLALIGEMAAGMAHEIRNPLAAISGSIEILKNTLSPSDENSRLMKIALKESGRLNAIITEFLLYAKPQPPRRRWVDIQNHLAEMVDVIKNHPDCHPSTKIVFLPAPGPLMLMLDPDQMRQAFWNLAINALQAMPTGGEMTIQIKKVRLSRSSVGEGVEVIFKDTGGGIPEKNRLKIFNPFFTTKDSGSGLGLPIVKRIVEEHYGKIETESSDSGTAFHLYFPLDESAALRDTRESPKKPENINPSMRV